MWDVDENFFLSYFNGWLADPLRQSWAPIWKSLSFPHLLLRRAPGLSALRRHPLTAWELTGGGAWEPPHPHPPARTVTHCTHRSRPLGVVSTGGLFTRSVGLRL